MTGAPAGSCDLVVTGIGVALPWTAKAERALTSGFGAVPADGSWFDVSRELGLRGYRYLPPAAHYLLAAARRAVADAGGMEHQPPNCRAAVLGTNRALASMFAEIDQTVSSTHGEHLSPASAPYFAVNVIGTRLCIEHQLRAFAMTITSPLVAALEAIEAASRAARIGRCGTALVAAMEHSGVPGAPDAPAEQGAAVLVLEPSGVASGRAAAVRGRVGARTFFAPPSRVERAEERERLVRTIGAWLDGQDPQGRAAIHPVLDASPVGKAIAEALHERAGDRVVHPVTTAGAGSLTPMVRVAGLLATGVGDAVVVAGTGEGNVGLAWLSPGATGAGGDEPC